MIGINGKQEQEDDQLDIETYVFDIGSRFTQIPVFFSLTFTLNDLYMQMLV